jgi:hypothetical protein
MLAAAILTKSTISNLITRRYGKLRWFEYQWRAVLSFSESIPSLPFSSLFFTRLSLLVSHKMRCCSIAYNLYCFFTSMHFVLLTTECLLKIQSSTALYMSAA